MTREKKTSKFKKKNVKEKTKQKTHEEYPKLVFQKRSRRLIPSDLSGDTSYSGPTFFQLNLSLLQSGLSTEY